MNYSVQTISSDAYPPLLQEIPDPPKELFLRGMLPPQGTKCLAVVGSRDYSNYGKQVVEYLVHGLRGHAVSIISGLALGIDALAHESALHAGLYTLAVPGSGIDDSVLYPRRNRALAWRILENGGGILSEFEPTMRATTWSFPQRNRIMAGLSHAVLLIEARERSGTLITARLATDYNRDVLVVPGSIFNENSRGAHQFLKLGATPITTPEDILITLGLETQTTSHTTQDAGTEKERIVLEALGTPVQRDVLTRALGMSTSEISILLMGLELSGRIKEENGVFYRLF